MFGKANSLGNVLALEDVLARSPCLADVQVKSHVACMQEAQFSAYQVYHVLFYRAGRRERRWTS